MNTPLRSPYLRTQRQFPNDDTKELANQIDHTYIDIASKVNVRAIALFFQSFPCVTGERWTLNGNTQPVQTLRQEYVFGAISSGETDIPTNIGEHGFITKITGSVYTTNGSNSEPDWRPLPYIDPLDTNNFVLILVGQAGSPLNECIRVVVGTDFPPINYGCITIEWMADQINFVADPTL